MIYTSVMAYGHTVSPWVRHLTRREAELRCETLFVTKYPEQDVVMLDGQVLVYNGEGFEADWKTRPMSEL